MIGGISMMTRILMLSAAGLITLELLMDALALVPVVVLGTVVGTRFFRRADSERFFAALQWLLLTSAALLVARGVGEMMGGQ